MNRNRGMRLECQVARDRMLNVTGRIVQPMLVSGSNSAGSTERTRALQKDQKSLPRS